VKDVSLLDRTTGTPRRRVLLELCQMGTNRSLSLRLRHVEMPMQKVAP
jgi:hypothetical protein